MGAEGSPMSPQLHQLVLTVFYLYLVLYLVRMFKGSYPNLFAY